MWSRDAKLRSHRHPTHLIIITIYASSVKETGLKFLCEGSDVPEGKSRGFELSGVQMLAVRRTGQVFIYKNHCPHRGVPLEWLPDQFLDSSASLIQCATHGALFLIEDGECVAGPCEGKSLTPIVFREDAKGIWVNLRASD
jgi:nitrite reductase/ring-hydroxylating ferredoxin subunit